MTRNSCAAAASAGGCIETDNDNHRLVPHEPPAPVAEPDYSGFDVVKATQVS